MVVGGKPFSGAVYEVDEDGNGRKKFAYVVDTLESGILVTTQSKPFFAVLLTAAPDTRSW